MSLQSQISDVVTRIATEFKTVKSKLSGNTSGDLSGLTTSVKTSLLAAINELVSSLSGKQDSLGFTPENSANKGAANGYAPLDASAKVPAANLPSYVDDVEEYANFAGLPGTGETGKLYVTLDTNKVYRWTGSGYVEISSSLVLGETSSTAYRGDRGKTAYDHSQLVTGNPHAVTFAQLGSKPTTISGFGITDAYTKTEIGTVTQNFVTEFEAALV
jgi:hypothetical protein